MRTSALLAVVVIAGVIAGAGGTAYADLLGVKFEYPWNITWWLDAQYQPGSPEDAGVLTVTGGGFPWHNYWAAYDAEPLDIFGGSFSLTAVIDKTSHKALSGSLEVWADVDNDGFDDLLAFSDDLRAFGYSSAVNSYQLFDFRFKGSGLMASSENGGIRVLLDTQTFVTEAFDFATTQTYTGAKADIPEPATLTALLLAAGVCFAKRRNRI